MLNMVNNALSLKQFSQSILPQTLLKIWKENLVSFTNLKVFYFLNIFARPREIHYIYLNNESDIGYKMLLNCDKKGV